jgi:hypothetical protein
MYNAATIENSGGLVDWCHLEPGTYEIWDTRWHTPPRFTKSRAVLVAETFDDDENVEHDLWFVVLRKATRSRSNASTSRSKPLRELSVSHPCELVIRCVSHETDASYGKHVDSNYVVIVDGLIRLSVSTSRITKYPYDQDPEVNIKNIEIIDKPDDQVWFDELNALLTRDKRRLQEFMRWKSTGPSDIPHDLAKKLYDYMYFDVTRIPYEHRSPALRSIDGMDGRRMMDAINTILERQKRRTRSGRGA